MSEYNNSSSSICKSFKQSDDLSLLCLVYFASAFLSDRNDNLDALSLYNTVARGFLPTFQKNMIFFSFLSVFTAICELTNVSSGISRCLCLMSRLDFVNGISFVVVNSSDIAR